MTDKSIYVDYTKKTLDNVWTLTNLNNVWLSADWLCINIMYNCS